MILIQNELEKSIYTNNLWNIWCLDPPYLFKNCCATIKKPKRYYKYRIFAYILDQNDMYKFVSVNKNKQKFLTLRSAKKALFQEISKEFECRIVSKKYIKNLKLLL